MGREVNRRYVIVRLREHSSPDVCFFDAEQSAREHYRFVCEGMGEGSLAIAAYLCQIVDGRRRATAAIETESPG